MNVSVILAHPSKDSFNHAIAHIVDETLRANEHAVSLHDLYAEGFDPILPAAEIAKGAKLDPMVSAHCEEIATVSPPVVKSLKTPVENSLL
ncbi:MAG: NAD(P)H-dependent oxidoreductase [Candidatus Aquicultor sp.]|nr:NAD(P)H-dependent oxidoreductase [Candidatus Aquicultor sp.]